MRHGKVAKKLGRTKAHREQLLGSLVVNLILQNRIRTTLPKARQARRDAEKMVTLARRNTLAARRLAAARLRRPAAVKRLFDQVLPALSGRAGGFARIVKLGCRRGDGAAMALLEWVAAVPAAPAAPATQPPAAGKPAAKT